MSNVTNINIAGSGTGLNATMPAPIVHKGLATQPAVVPVVPMAQMTLNDKVVHEAERVITHQPIVEKQIINERPLEVRQEHHIQPIIHETEHRIQPIIKTQATTEQTLIEKDKNVLLAPIVERAAMPAGLQAVDRQTAEGILHKPIIETQIINERPVEVRHEHHVQPIIHEREHRIQPIIKTEATSEQKHIVTDRNVQLAPIIERAAMPLGLEAVDRATAEGVIHKPKLAKDIVVEHPVIVKHEHHVQPIVHEREHHIQPIIKTEVTAAQTHVRTDRNVLLEPIVERAALPLGLEAVERAGADGIVHRAKLEKEIIVEHPVTVKHERHIQPVIHERIHEIQPVIQTNVTAEQRVIEQQHTVMLPPIVEPTVFVGQRPGMVATNNVNVVNTAAMPLNRSGGAIPVVAAPASTLIGQTGTGMHGTHTREQRKALKAQHKAQRKAMKTSHSKEQRKALKAQHKAERKAMKHGGMPQQNASNLTAAPSTTPTIF